jgi:hypothetical protein
MLRVFNAKYDARLAQRGRGSFSRKDAVIRYAILRRCHAAMNLLHKPFTFLKAVTTGIVLEVGVAWLRLPALLC